MARHRNIYVRCDACDQLHVARYERDYPSAIGPQPVWVATCPLFDMTMDYTEDEAVQVP